MHGQPDDYSVPHHELELQYSREIAQTIFFSTFDEDIRWHVHAFF
jgi:hypothetical protein